MDIDCKISVFSKLGRELTGIGRNESYIRNNEYWNHLIEDANLKNPWFTQEFIRSALNNIGKSLTETKLKGWTKDYPLNIQSKSSPKTIGIVNAGNIPAVGFHDFLCVIFSGNKYQGKLSSLDDVLLPAIGEFLIKTEPGLEGNFEFTREKLTGFDAVIATGSNNTARYFEYYFGKYPHIIRRNRNGVAVLTGDESEEELKMLADDIFLYFGMGCRSVSKLFLPEGYDFGSFFKSVEKYSKVLENNKYRNNYDYYKAIFLVNREKYLDNGFLMLVENRDYASPPAVVYYQHYSTIKEVFDLLKADAGRIQCIVGANSLKKDRRITRFGKSQQPELWDYADGIDTMEFLCRLNS